MHRYGLKRFYYHGDQRATDGLCYCSICDSFEEAAHFNLDRPCSDEAPYYQDKRRNRTAYLNRNGYYRPARPTNIFTGFSKS